MWAVQLKTDNTYLKSRLRGEETFTTRLDEAKVYTSPGRALNALIMAEWDRYVRERRPTPFDRRAVCDHILTRYNFVSTIRSVKA